MSSVGSADKRNSQDEALRRIRETYEENEAADAKKHSNEVKRLTEAHRAEINSMQESHNAQMEELKVKTAEALTQRDMRFQKETQELRELNQQNLRKQALQMGNRSTQTENTLRDEIDRVQRTNNEQKKQISTQFQQQIREKDKNFEDYSARSREALQKATVEQRDKLNQVHGREMKAVIADRNMQQEKSQNEFDRMRTTKDNEIRDIERTKKNDISRIMIGNDATLKDQAANYKQGLDEARQSFDEGLSTNRTRYQKALSKHTDDMNNSTENFKASISERINDRLNVGEAENHRLKNELTRQQSAMNRQKDREVKNTRTSMQANIEKLERDRLDTVSEANAKTAEEIAKLTKKNDDLIHRTNRFYQEKIVNDRSTADERMNRAVNTLDERNQHQELRNESRVAKLMAQNDRDEANLRSFFDQSTSSQKKNFENTLVDMRDRNRQDQDTIIQSFTKQSAEREAKFQSKLTETNSRYEKQIQEIKDQNERALRDQGALNQREKKQLVDQKNLEIQRQAGQYENRLAKMEEIHKREVDTINKRHEESLANLTKATKKT